MILIKISLKLAPKDAINNTSALVHTMVWRWTGEKLLFAPMMTQVTNAYMPQRIYSYFPKPTSRL